MQCPCYDKTVKIVTLVVNIIFVVFSLYVLFSGLTAFIHTSGRVWGSEFGLLVLIAHELSLLLLWLALFGLCYGIKTRCQGRGGDTADSVSESSSSAVQSGYDLRDKAN